MNRERLIEAIQVLKDVHERNLTFNYSYWGRRDKDTLSPEKVQHTCNTEACAGGYLALHPPFNAQDLVPLALNDLTPVLKYNTDCDAHGTHALAEFFDIGLTDARRIFVEAAHYFPDRPSNQKITALDIAELLQKLLDQNLEAK